MDNQAAVTKALTDYAGMSEADAKKTVDEWTTSYKNLKTELEKAKAVADQKAREAAERARKDLSCAATVSFFAFIIGLVATVIGGICGAKKTYRHTTWGIDSDLR
jgi:biopolymer transport protein ExbB/TolQ